MEPLIMYCIAGCCCGIITGLIPGVHTNTLSLIVLALLPFGGINLAVLVVSMAIVHSFVDFIPSILIGVPDTDTVLAILPGHQLFHQGNALDAILLTVTGGLAAGAASILFIPLISLFLVRIQKIIPYSVPFVLGAILVGMVIGKHNRWWNTIVVVLSGLLGMVVLQGTKPLPNPLFPLITGLFGASGIVHGYISKTPHIEQKARTNPVSEWGAGIALALSGVSGMLVALLPSMGASQAAFIVQRAVGNSARATYLMIIGGINTTNTLISIVVWFVIGTTRTGTAVAVNGLIAPHPHYLLILSGAMLFSIGFGAIATLAIGKYAIVWVSQVPLKIINGSVGFLLFSLVLILSGPVGALVFITAAGIGTTALFRGVKRTQGMASLMVPTLVFYSHAYYFM